MAGKVKKVDTTIERKGLEHPHLDITVSDYGRITAELEVDREKANGGVEYIVLKFELNDYNLECIGQQAVQGLRRLRQVNDRAIVNKLERVTGWAEGDGPGV